MTEPSGILLVEDDHALSALLRTILQRSGNSVEVAFDGLEALEKIAQHRYALVLLDLMLPKLDGYGVIERLADESPEDRPVVVVVSAVADDHIARIDSRVVAGVIRKPFDVHELDAVVNACINTGGVTRFGAPGRPFTLVRPPQ